MVASVSTSGAWLPRRKTCLLMGRLFGAQRGLVALPHGPSFPQGPDADLQLGMVDRTMEAVEHPKRKLGEFEIIPLAPGR